MCLSPLSMGVKVFIVCRSSGSLQYLCTQDTIKKTAPLQCSTYTILLLCFSIYRVRLYFFYGSQSSAVSVNLKVHILRSEIKLTSWYHYLCIPATLMAQWEMLMRPRHTPASKTGRWQQGQRSRRYRPYSQINEL